MEIRKCKRCDRLFQYTSNNYCPSCVLEMDKIFITVREYIYENPRATVPEVAENTGVESEIIMEFLRDGKLELREYSALLTCMKCGKKILSGKMCRVCYEQFDREMRKGLADSGGKGRSISDSQKMHAAEFLKKKQF